MFDSPPPIAPLSPPPAPAAPPKLGSTLSAGQAVRRSATGGMASTIATSPMGVTSPATIARKTLLGA